MKKYYLSAALLSISFLTNAQVETYKINPGQKISDVIPDSSQYASKSFVRGKILMKNGQSGVSLINYNWLFDEMMFINEEGDTLSIVDSVPYSYFVINADTFYYENAKKSYLKKIYSLDDIILAEMKNVKMSDVHKMGAMGVPSATLHSDRVGQTEAPTSYRELTANELLTLTVEKEYYIKSKSGKLYRATKKNIEKVIPNKHKSALNAYLRANSINYNKAEDLVKILSSLKED